MTRASDRFPSPNEQQIHVSLPCTPDHFAEFITGLLGRPQTIRRRAYMLFDIDRSDLVSLYHLIVQRVEQQNDAHLMQFVAVITFHDQSSTRITSLKDFEEYNEVRPLRSIAVLLNFVFLINFRDRRYPEKQEITVHFMAPEAAGTEGRSSFTFDEEDMPFVFFDLLRARKLPGVIQVEIKYTARTWGNDVDNLLRGQIENLQKNDNPALRFIHKKSSAISLGVGLAIFALGLIALSIYTNRIDLASETMVMQILDAPVPFEEKMINALKELVTQEVSLGEQISPRAVFLVGFIASSAAAIGLGVATDKAATGLARRARVRLTRLSESRAADDHVMFKRRIATFVGVQVLNIIIGLLMILVGKYLVV